MNGTNGQLNTGQADAVQPIDLDGVFTGGITTPNNGVSALDGVTAPITDNPVPPINNPVPPVSDSVITGLIGDNITDENKLIRDEVLSEVKGANITEQGITNNKGELILNLNDLNTYLETGALPTNELGQVVDSNGNLLNEVSDEGNKNDEDSLVLKTKNQIQDYFGLEIEGDFEDTEEGLIKLTEKAIEITEEKAISSFLQNNPIINDFVNHLKIGGNPNEFNADLVDYSAINTNELSLDTRLNFIKKKLTAQGVDDADDIIGLYKTAGEAKILEETRKAVEFLKEKQERDSLLKQEEANKREAQEQESIKKYWGEIKETVTKGKINNINIPINDRQKFFEYLSKPVAGNKSQEMIDAEKEPIDFELMVSYLRYKKGDIGKLTAVLAAENKVNTLRERMNKHNTSVQGNGISSKQGNPNAGIDVNRIF